MLHQAAFMMHDTSDETASGWFTCCVILISWWFNSCRAQFISGNIDQYFHSRQIVNNQGAQVSENFPREYKDPFTQQSQYYGSKFPGSGRSQDISNHGDDLVLFFYQKG